MSKKINNFWLGFIAALALSFITAYLSWPKLPLDKELISGTKVILPKPGSPAGIYYPQDGDKISDVFIVYGSGMAFENQGIISLTDSNGKTLLTTSIYFHSPDIGQTGPFITALDLTQVKTEAETAVLELYEEDAATGKKIVIDSVNVRLK